MTTAFIILILFTIFLFLVKHQEQRSKKTAREDFKNNYVKPVIKPAGVRLQAQLKREHENLRIMNDRVLNLKASIDERQKLKKWQDRAEQLLNEFNLSEWKFYWINNKTTCGLCYNQLQVISLSRFFVLHCSNNAEIEDTIRHEIGHALCDIKEGHGKNWKAMAKIVGYKSVRCASASVIPSHAKRKFVGLCPRNHKHVRLGFKRPRQNKSCSHCDPYYNEKYIIHWQEVSE